MTVAVIPCYNEDKTIGKVVYGCLRHVDRVVVIDNNSSDMTVPIALAAGAEVYYCPVRGMGSALRVGTERSAGDSAVVTLDGDGQHDPADIPRLLTVLKDGVDIAIGIRDFTASGMPQHRKVGNYAISVACGLGVIDSQCGLRAFRRTALDTLDIQEHGFGCITELLIKARKSHLRIAYIPVSCHYHEDYRMNSTLNPVRHGVLALATTLKWRVRSLV